jgi:arylsulfatase A-like enzyme
LEDARGRDLLDDESAQGWSFNFETGIHTCARSGRLSIPPGARGPVRLAFRGSLSVPREKLRELYRREVEYMDARIGELFKKLRRLGIWNRTHILVAGDHGEGLGEYRKDGGTWHFGHIRYLYDVYLRVPLIVHSPSLSKTGVKVKRLTSLLDVAPTILDLVGWKKPPGYLGSSVLEKSREGPRSLFQATFHPESDRDRFGLLQPPYHMILTPGEDLIELYNIEEDPGEKKNLYTDSVSNEPAADLRRRLLTGARRILKARRVRTPDSRTEEMLRALGYIR